jgi:hypothetical protein
MELATKYNFSPTQSAFLLTFGDSVVAQPLLRLRTHYVTSQNVSLYNAAFTEKKPKNFISFMSRGFTTKFANDLIGWSVFYSFDPFIKRYARNHSTTDAGYYGIVFAGYSVAGSITEIALAPFKFCLTQVQKHQDPMQASNPASLLKWATRCHGRAIFTGSVPSICSAASKLLSTSIIQDRLDKKYQSSKEVTRR